MLYPNRNLLAEETSPYLRQHADNPVHWRAWNEAALDEARETGKPILLSIGYAACHWCHVMAHESFEDEGVAQVMNDLFVNIKVDREERPDLDQIYMTALSAMGQQGGWPLTMFLTPDAEAFHGGTYFPRTSNYGRPGFVDVMRAVERHWISEQDKIAHNVEALRQHLTKHFTADSNPVDLHQDIFDGFADNIWQMTDTENGGLRGAPKFPSAPFMDALWLSRLRTSNQAHRDAFLLSIRKMLQGGIYDHVGGGLARYSVDDRWLVPHFEKMLYDNAQMLRHAAWAFNITNDETFRIRIEETIAWLLREMVTQDGAFASSLDADSEGEEGRFYVWQKDEIDEILGRDPLFDKIYDVTPEGNWEGKVIPNRLGAPDSLNSTDEAHLADCLRKLKDARSKRVRPARDDKVLTDWNGLAIRSLAETGRLFEREDWVNSARKNYRSVCESMRDGRLPHATLGDSSRFPAFSSDYASMINAALSLYQCDFNIDYIRDAIRWLDILDQWHLGSDGIYMMTAKDANDIIIPLRGDQDDAVPSATAQIIEAITRLANVTGNIDLSLRSRQIAEDALGRVMKQKYGMAGILNTASIVSDPRKLIIVAPDKAHPLVTEANRNPDPRRMDAFIAIGANDEPLLGMPKGMILDTTKPAAWLCRGLVCLAPVDTPQELRQLLQEG
ncbi:MAG: thioredoxin domain-containing protein [Phyllobacterium sp.]